MIIGFDAKRFFHNSSGLGNYSRDLVYKMADLFNDEMFIFNPNRDVKFNLDIDYKDKLKEVNPKGVFYNKFNFLWRYSGIIKDIKKYKIDVFHGLSSELPRGIHKIDNIKKIVTVHDLIFIRYPNLYSWFDAKIHLSKVKYACDVSDEIIATSNQTKMDIIDFLKIEESKIKVIYQGCNDFYNHNFNSSYKINIIEKYSLPEKFILNVGTIEKRKNIITILKALKELPSDINLVLIGKKKFNYFQEISNYIDDNNLKHRVWFLENLVTSEIAVIYKMAYCFVYPSIFEGFGIPLIEAMYSKVPIITSNVSSLPEIAGKNSFTIDPLDYQDLRKKIEILLTDNNIVRDMVKKNYDYVVNTFDKEKLTKQVYDLYK